MSEFSSTVNQINSGNTETELSLRLKEIVSAVSETGKKGKLTLTLTIERNKKNARLMEVTAEVKAVVPTPPPPSAAYLLHEGNLIALEDTQMRLPLERQIDGPQEVAERARLDAPSFTEVEVLK